MPNERKIRTTGELREVLAEVIIDVREGRIKTDDARMIHKLAHAMNDSIFGETKKMQVQIELKHDVSSFGLSPIGEPTTRADLRTAA